MAHFEPNKTQQVTFEPNINHIVQACAYRRKRTHKGAFMGLIKKKRPKYGYSTGVIIDGQSWIENKDGNLSGTATYRMSNTRFYSSKKAAMKHAEEIAACFPDSKKAKPFVGSYRFDK